jgi:hypothetical protein
LQKKILYDNIFLYFKNNKKIMATNNNDDLLIFSEDSGAIDF